MYHQWMLSLILSHSHARRCRIRSNVDGKFIADRIY